MKLSFGTRLRYLRKQNNLTQEQLGKIIHVSKVSISGYENGNRFPDTATLQALAHYFEVSTDYLLEHSVPNSSLKNCLPKDIEEEFNTLIKDLNSSTEILFHGTALTKEQKELISTLLTTNLEVCHHLIHKK